MPIPVTRPLIQRAEEALGVRFPKDYADRILQDNGGEVMPSLAVDDTWWLFPIRDEKDTESEERTREHIVQETHKARALAGFPQEAVAFGHDGKGNFIVFLPEEEGSQQLSDQVFVWQRESQEVALYAEEFMELET